MLVVSSFEYTESIEIAIAILEENGVSKEKILAVPFTKKREEIKLFDSIHYSDGVSLFDLAAALGTAFSVLGASFGFVLTWGPIIWGLLGFAIGAGLGFIIDYFWTKNKIKKRANGPASKTEVVLIIECDETLGKTVEDILWKNLAIGVAKVKKQSNT
ncbi:hypothetical protein MM300_18690 [Evansella sp. LMS18]|jgi:hypothetical protein|uniref:hypothetical protein n=1 Tax=Evansella sp. LMS18 TaxID=2924033 RepID=UPI0020D089B4|nr:hypothetical protein [Evansella sp. LMS18]UTR09890.1 hypothetical protein MM300_18690 [Evansella sp. LMS18]